MLIIYIRNSQERRKTFFYKLLISTLLFTPQECFRSLLNEWGVTFLYRIMESSTKTMKQSSNEITVLTFMKYSYFGGETIFKDFKNKQNKLYLNFKHHLYTNVNSITVNIYERSSHTTKIKNSDFFQIRLPNLTRYFLNH